jgi:hypothetical protein
VIWLFLTSWALSCGQKGGRGYFNLPVFTPELLVPVKDSLQVSIIEAGFAKKKTANKDATAWSIGTLIA